MPLPASDKNLVLLFVCLILNTLSPETANVMSDQEDLEELIYRLHQAGLSKEEERVVFIPNDEPNPLLSTVAIESCLSSVILNLYGIKNVLACAWQLPSIKISKLRRNIFFTSVDDLHSAIDTEYRQ